MEVVGTGGLVSFPAHLLEIGEMKTLKLTSNKLRVLPADAATLS